MKIEQNPVTVINPKGKSEWIFICEHASNFIPNKYKDLGLTKEQLEKHIAYDIGAKNIALKLASKLDATVIICNISRLVIDCNRPLIHKELIPESSDGILIAGNQSLTNIQKLERINDFYLPFHKEVANIIAQKVIKNKAIKIANIHSFTAMLAIENIPRDWDISFIHKGDKLTDKIMKEISSQNEDIKIGDNKPYSGFIFRGYTIETHAKANEIPAFLVEFRQDNIKNDGGINLWANRLLQALINV